MVDFKYPAEIRERRMRREQKVRQQRGSDTRVCATCWWWQPDPDALAPDHGYCERMELDGAGVSTHVGVSDLSCAVSEVWIVTGREFGCNQWEDAD